MAEGKADATPSVRWYLVGFASLGMLAGLTTGLSASPVVSTLLPLLFTLLGGASGLYLAKADANTAIGRWRLRTIGQNLVVFALCCGVFMLGGISVRTGVPPASLLAPLVGAVGEAETSGESVLHDKLDPLEVGVLRAKLHLLGLQEPEIRQVLDSEARKAGAAGSRGLDARLARILPLMEALHVALESDLHVITGKEGEAEVRQSVRMLESYEVDWKAFAVVRVTNAPDADLASAMLMADETMSLLSSLMVMQQEAGVALFTSQNSRLAMREVSWALAELKNSAASPSEAEPHNRLNAFLELLSSSKAPFGLQQLPKGRNLASDSVSQRALGGSRRIDG